MGRLYGCVLYCKKRHCTFSHLALRTSSLWTSHCLRTGTSVARYPEHTRSTTITCDRNCGLLLFTFDSSILPALTVHTMATAESRERWYYDRAEG
jgi:hypothetical protein